MVAPGHVSALTVSPCGNYCVVAVAEKIHVWMVRIASVNISVSTLC